MEIPRAIRESSLYLRLNEDDDLRSALLVLRANAASLADTIARSVPTFTDHSIRHMDALWRVTDRVLTPHEIEMLSAAEAFLLAAGFYLHDIGMAYAATAEGLGRIRNSTHYHGFLQSFPLSGRGDPNVQARAVAYAVRKIHAGAATELATSPVPGTNINLIEPREIRESWGPTCGRIAASHHWDLESVERRLGSIQSVALPGGRKGDLGYVAAILRVVDYAHINRDRAPTIDRAFRRDIEEDSLVHWLAQEQIDGPERDANYLQYRASAQLNDIDAWWLYYDMMKGLDAEIKSVRRYLDKRTSSFGRLSLVGVRGAESPEAAFEYIPTAGFMPIEVQIRAGSVDRLVQLLAGESLYGPDPLAAVRELIQNARDAVMLKAAVATSELDKAALAIPIQITLTTSNPARLEVTDWGIGMTRRVITDFLIAIASDYWSAQFHIDFPSLQGFQPAGKFGIGFLSVFMLGDDVVVETNRSGEERYQLTLRGVGRRGEIRALPPASGSGTRVSVRLKQSVLTALKSFPVKVRIYAPMLRHPLQVDVDGKSTVIAVDWLNELTPTEMRSWTLNAVETLRQNRDRFGRVSENARRADFLYRYALLSRHTAEEPDWISGWPEYREKGVRLVASFDDTSLLCLRGLALQPIRTPGFVGVIDVDSATPDASRRQALDANFSEILARARDHVKGLVIENLNALSSQIFVVAKLGFLAQCVSAYGREVLLESTVPWISVIQMPGDVKQVSCGELVQKLRNANSLFLVYNAGPWGAMKTWTATEIPSAEVGIVLDGEDLRSKPDYVRSDQERIGPLSTLWRECIQAELFGTVLAIVAETWQVSVELLAQQDGWHHVESKLWGRIVRPR